MKHALEMGGQPLHESDGTPIGTMTDSNGNVHELTECKFCGVKMSRPIRNNNAFAQEVGKEGE